MRKVDVGKRNSITFATSDAARRSVQNKTSTKHLDFLEQMSRVYFHSADYYVKKDG